MKYSFIMPYYNRPELRFTLQSYIKYYSKRNDYEIVIIEDTKNRSNPETHQHLLDIIEGYKSTIPIRIILDPKVSYNPSTKYNLGAREATGEILLLTNPEVLHASDVLSFIDKSDMENLYIVCACASAHLIEDKGTLGESKFKFHMWYQHTQHRDVRYHFCTVVKKNNYINRIKGFDERYSDGIAYDDDNFVKRVLKAGLIVFPVDDLVTYHIEHSRYYQIDTDTFNRLVEKNRRLWASQLATGDF